jgi:hypothetical protein
MDIHRGSDAMIITVLFGAHRPLEDKRKATSAIIRLVSDALGVSQDDIFLALIPEDPVVSEIRTWFFGQYVAKWVSIGASKDGDPRAIFQYWGVPMYASSPNMNRWLMTDDDVLSLLSANQKPLQAANYTHTEVLDSAITAFNNKSGSVDAIWSRRRRDESEIERRAVHFEVRRTELGWRVIALASQLTDRDRLAEVWRTGSADAPGSDGSGAGARSRLR